MRTRPLTRDLPELLVLGLFAALSLWTVALALWQVVRAGAIWTGVDGVLPQDQFQYLAWIRDGSRHVLSSDMFGLDARPHDYLQPAIAISAGLTALGVAPWLALLLWKPVGVVALGLATRALVRRQLDGSGPRLAALALALLFTGWGALIAAWTGGGSFKWIAITNELWLVFWTWGYPFGLLALAAVITALIAYARDRDAGRIGPAAPVLAALASWLHPWQGELLALLLIGAEAVMWAQGRRRPRVLQLLLTLTGAALPLAYYVILRNADVSWQLAQESGHREWPFWMIVVSLAPLALPAALAYAKRPAGFLDAAIRLWPVGAVVVFFIAQTPHASGALHAWLGITIPLAILAVQGVQALPRSAAVPPSVVALALLALIAPPAVHALRAAHKSIHYSLSVSAAGVPPDARFVLPDVRDALDWLRDDPRAGGVLAPTYLGTAVPGETGRHAWVGNSYWSGSPRTFFLRDGATRSLFTTPIPPEVARGVVRIAGARFVLVDCATRPTLTADLGGLVRESHRFGCARVLVLSDAAIRRR